MGTELYFLDLQRTIIRKNIFSNFFTVKHIFIGKKQPHATRPLYYPSLTPLHLRQGYGGGVNHQSSKTITGTHSQVRVTRHRPVVRIRGWRLVIEPIAWGILMNKTGKFTCIVLFSRCHRREFSRRPAPFAGKKNLPASYTTPRQADCGNNRRF